MNLSKDIDTPAPQPKSFISTKTKGKLEVKEVDFEGPQSWETELEKLALTEPDPNQAVYNLPQLKAFIAEQITRAEHNHNKALCVNCVRITTASTVHKIRERIEKILDKWLNAELVQIKKSPIYFEGLKKAILKQLEQ